MPTTEQDIHPTYHVVMLGFDGVDTADRILHRLKEAHGLGNSEVEAEAVILRDADGHVRLHERGAAGVGATLGAVTAGVIGLVTGPVLLLALLVAGAVAGGVAGHFAGQILPPDDLREVGESLPPGSSAYLAVVDAAHASALVSAFADEHPRVLNVPVETELSSVIREAITHHVERI